MTLEECLYGIRNLVHDQAGRIQMLEALCETQAKRAERAEAKLAARAHDEDRVRFKLADEAIRLALGRAEEAESEVGRLRANCEVWAKAADERDRLNTEVARLREALESIIKVQDDQTIWPAYSNEKGKRMGAAIENARAAMRGGGK